MIRVSVIMPVYRTPPEFLRAAVESVLGQTLTDWELLIIDDAPDEPVRATLEPYLGDSRIKYVANERNLGMARSRNRGLDAARGEFVALLDHDDEFLPDKLEIMSGFMRERDDCDLLYTPVEFFGERTGIQRFRSGNTLNEMLKMSDIHSCSAVVMRRRSIEKRSLRFDPRCEPADDYDFYLRLLALGGRIFRGGEDEALTRYRLHSGNVSKEAHRVHLALARIERKLAEILPDGDWLLRWNLYRSRAWALRTLGEYYCRRGHTLYGRRCFREAQRIFPVNPKNWRGA